MPSIITDTFDYNDIIRVLDQDEAYVHHQVDDLQPKYFRIMQQGHKNRDEIVEKLARYKKAGLISYL